jgi:hypothetical protein
MSMSEIIAFVSAGLCLMIGLLTGVWKYIAIMKSPKHQAPVYVDIAHRAALMYSFACLVLLEFARVSKTSRKQLKPSLLPVLLPSSLLPFSPTSHWVLASIPRINSKKEISSRPGAPGC